MKFPPALIHIACWLGVYLIAVGIVGEMTGFDNAWNRPAFFIAWLAMVFYFHLLVVLPRLLGTGKTQWYVLAVGATILGGLGLGVVVHDITEVLFPPVSERELELAKLRSVISLWSRQLPPVVLSLALSGVVWNNQQLRKRKEESTMLRNQVLEAEAKALKLVEKGLR